MPTIELSEKTLERLIKYKGEDETFDQEVRTLIKIFEATINERVDDW